MNSKVVAAMAAAFLLGHVSAALGAPAKFTLGYEKVRDVDQPFLSRARADLSRVQGKPDSIKALPDGLGKPFYYMARLGGNNVMLLIDAAREPQLFVDLDMDGDLAEEGPCNQKRDRSRSPDWYVFGPVSIKPPGSETEIEFFVRAYVRAGREPYLRVRPARYRSGKIELAGVSYRLAVVDAQLDGRYDRAFEPKRGLGGDWLAIDLDRNGRFGPSMYRSPEIMPLPRLLPVKDTYYSIEVLPDGSAIRFDEVMPEFGRLDVGTGNVELLLFSDSGFHHLKGPEGAWELPAGNYTATELILQGNGQGRVKWSLRCYFDTGKLANFRIGEGQTTSFEIGPPLSGKARVDQRGRDVYIHYSVLGQAGEEYPAGADRSGTRQPAPRFKVVSESGKTLTSGSFEYG